MTFEEYLLIEAEKARKAAEDEVRLSGGYFSEIRAAGRLVYDIYDDALNLYREWLETKDGQS